MEDLPSEGAATADVRQQVHARWLELAAKYEIDLSDFPGAKAELEERILWARRRELDVAAILSRYSTQMQTSTLAQVMDCLEYGVAHGMYVPPELICVDEGISGRKARRAGLERMKKILSQKRCSVLLVFKVSRLYRVGYRGLQFFNEEVVENGLRGVSVTQGIDTADKKQWQMLLYLHGLMDEMLLTAISDHVRSGLKDLFRQGYVTGAVGVGFTRKPIEGAPTTKRGLPRTMPVRDERAQPIIVRAFERVRDGMPLARAHRMYVAEGGPADPRSTLGYMSYQAFRRLLSNPRLMGIWAFGRKRNEFSTKRDYTRQIAGPEIEVQLIRSDELRVVEDELFYAVQQVLAKHKSGPRGPRKARAIGHLADLVIDCFVCDACPPESPDEEPVRYYKAGAYGKAMSCKRGHLCRCQLQVDRRKAVEAVLATLESLVFKDARLVETIEAEAAAFDAREPIDVERQAEDVRGRLRSAERKVKILVSAAGQDDESKDDDFVKQLTEARANVARLRGQLARLERDAERQAVKITPEGVRASLAGLSRLLHDAGCGVLGEEAMFKAAAVFRRLVGGRISVRGVARAGRDRMVVQGVFTPQVLQTVREELGLPEATPADAEPVVVWLRPPPRCDQLAERAHQLIDSDGHSFRSAAKEMTTPTEKVTSARVWQLYQRYYQMIGQPVPKRPYNNGRPRRAT
ncbi:MAG: recombinase [Pirellula sp.]|nr:recombinase [Pirellula sp.]